MYAMSTGCGRRQVAARRATAVVEANALRTLHANVLLNGLVGAMCALLGSQVIAVNVDASMVEPRERSVSAHRIGEARSAAYRAPPKMVQCAVPTASATTAMSNRRPVCVSLPLLDLPANAMKTIVAAAAMAFARATRTLASAPASQIELVPPAPTAPEASGVPPVKKPVSAVAMVCVTVSPEHALATQTPCEGTGLAPVARVASKVI